MVLETRTAEKPLGGLLIHGEYYAAEPAARLINNYLAPGLRSKSGLFRAYLGAGNVLNQFQLGLSAFHLGFTSMDVAISCFALALLKASRGDLGGALREAFSTPAAPITNLLKGDKVLKEWFSPGSQGAEIAKIVDALKAGGGRAQVDRFYQTHLTDRMMDALDKGNPIGAAVRAPFALVEQAAKPILESIVPRQKLGFSLTWPRRNWNAIRL